MFQKGDFIVYGNTGVCRVEDIGLPDNIPTEAKGTLYYKLLPVRGTGVIYIPVDSTVFMRPVLSREAALKLISKIPDIQEEPYCGQDQRMLAGHYRTFLDSHECEGLIQLIKTVYTKNKSQSQKGKQPGKTDMQYMKRAEELLHGEISVALNIPFERVSDFLKQEVSKLDCVVAK